MQRAPAEGLFRELLYIHAMLRRDLETVRRLANDVRTGGSAVAIQEEIRNLETNSPLWRLKYGCTRYCRFVHHHHLLEDAALFPVVRKEDPSLNSVIDRLEEDHLKVHQITERIVVLADQLAGDASNESRDALVAALSDLEEHLLAHLDLEEESLGPLLSGWTYLPVE